MRGSLPRASLVCSSRFACIDRSSPENFSRSSSGLIWFHLCLRDGAHPRNSWALQALDLRGLVVQTHLHGCKFLLQVFDPVAQRLLVVAHPAPPEAGAVRAASNPHEQSRRAMSLLEPGWSH